MTLEAKLMLGKLYDVFTEQFHDPVQAWDRFIEFIAADHSIGLVHQLDHKFEWLFQNQDLLSDVFKIYDPKVLSSSFDDDLGDLYYERIAGVRTTPDDPRTSQLETLAGTDKPITVLYPAVGTGTRLFAIHRNNPNAVVFGADPDLRAVRVAFTNSAIHGIPVYLLHADYRIHDLSLDIENRRANWQYANRWNSSIDKLRKLPQTGFKPGNQRERVEHNARRATHGQ